MSDPGREVVVGETQQRPEESVDVVGVLVLPADRDELRRVVQVGEDRLLGRPPGQGGASGVASPDGLK
jgi:hypothetical protein